MQKYFLHGKLTANEGFGDQLAEILIKASELVFTAEGANFYLVSRDENEPDAVWVTELWDTKEDHDNSLQVEGVRELIQQAIPILAGAPQKGQELRLIGGSSKFSK